LNQLEKISANGEEIRISGAKKQVIFGLSFILLLYFTASFFGYRSIWAASERVEKSHLVLIEEVEKGNTFIHPQINKYNEEIEIYERNKSLLQTFWIKFIIDFPSYEETSYEQFKPRMEELKKTKEGS
jgi:hypothetical protein